MKKRMMMRRRSFLQGTGALATSGLFAPALAQQGSNVLRFVPHASLPHLDPVFATQYIVRNGSALIYDTLYGVDSDMEPQPQMAEGHEVSDDGRVWTFRLREGLRFHDGEPVRSADVIASFRRVFPRDVVGRMLEERLDEMVVIDDRTFEIRLNEAFPELLFAMAKPSPWFVMPERLASTPYTEQVSEFIGSGPMRLVTSEWVPGTRAVFEKNPEYVPRDEPGDWFAGGKRIHFDRVEWVVLPDPSTAVNALVNGEVDWVEQPLGDLVPILDASPDVDVDIADPLGNVALMRLNHLHPPFDDVRVRRALMMAIDQEDYMRAGIGADESLWRKLGSFVAPGTPGFSEAGGEIVTDPPDLDAARALLAEAGYDGTPITVLVGSDIPVNNAFGQVTENVLRRLGMNVDYVATDWATVAQRRARREPPAEGGWHILHTWSAGAETAFPPAYSVIRTHGEGWFGWPADDRIETLHAEWMTAGAEGRQAASDALNQALMDFVIHIPLGHFKSYQSWRSNIEGVQAAPFPVVWGVTRA